MSVSRLLVTEHASGDRFTLWRVTAPYSNWIEGRENAHGTETWLVTVFAEHRKLFLDTAARYGKVIVEEIDGAGDAEIYRPLVGEGVGWARRRWP